MPRITEFYPEKQGRPYVPESTSLDGRGFGLAPYSVRGIHLAGEFSRTSKTDDYTASDEMVILVDASGGGITITLPAAATSSAKVYWIKNIGSTGTVTIEGDVPAETIDGDVSIDLTLQYQYVMIICDSADWHILGGAYVRLEDVLKSQETLLESLRKQLAGIWKCLSSMSSLNNYKEES